MSLPLFVESLERGATSGVFRANGESERGENSGVFHANGEKPDVTQTQIPPYDLLDLTAYSDMSVQFSRGSPFQCEFCDMIVLYGRKPLTKAPGQLLAELQVIYDLG